MKRFVGLAATAALLIATPAVAEIVARREAGSIEFSLSQPAGLEAPRLVQVGESAWTETLAPRHLVRLTADSAERIRHGATPGVTAGTLMFGYTLSSGMAYCPPLAFGPGSQRVQCLRDFDADGTFDGSYVTPRRGQDSVLLVGELSGLTPMPKVGYEPADLSEAPRVPVHVIFQGWEDGQARFRMRVEQEWTLTTRSCAPESENVCSVFGVSVRATPAENGAAHIEFVSAAEDRNITVVFTD